MNTDIVERLRGFVPIKNVSGAMYDAATEIERLRALLQEAGEALEPFYKLLTANTNFNGLDDTAVIEDAEDDEGTLFEVTAGDYRRARTILSKIKGE